ncbi:MAG: hypothetical protein ACLFQO_10900 [Cyclobacteriaceae bacterium]
MRHLFLINLLAIVAFTSPSQNILQELKEKWQNYQQQYKSEQLHLMTSENLLAAGDTLWFGAHFLNGKTSSKVLYVEMLGNGGAVQQGIYPIRKGFAGGIIHIPDSLSSGSYQLRAYTQWTRNLGVSAFFHRQLLIINPYEEEESITRQTKTSAARQVPELQAGIKEQQLHISIDKETRGAYLMVRTHDTLLYAHTLQAYDTALSLPLPPGQTGLLEVAVLDNDARLLAEKRLFFPDDQPMLEVRANRTAYAPREKVTATISLPSQADAASFSVSVRKVHTPEGADQDFRQQWAENMAGSLPNWQELLTSPSIPAFLKEDEYLLLSGRLTDAAGKALPDEMALVSVSGRYPHFDYDQTDEEGVFHLPVYQVYGEREMVFQPDDASLQAQWIFEEKFAPANQPELHQQQQPNEAFWKHVLKEARLRANVRRQYQPDQAETDEAVISYSRFYGSPNYTIKLDDYISLPDFVEINRELMPGIRLRKVGANYEFHVFDVRTRTFFENQPALFLDGVLIKDANEIVSLPPADIDLIETVNRRTYYGDYRFDGVVAVYTKSGNAFDSSLPTSAIRREVRLFTENHPYVRADAAESHLPAFRTLLYWDAYHELKSGEDLVIEFNNADELGTFEIVAEGRSSQGTPIYRRATYTVRPGQHP